MDLAALIAKQMKAVLHIVYVVDDQVSSTSALACEENANQGTHMIIKEGGPVTDHKRGWSCDRFASPSRQAEGRFDLRWCARQAMVG